MKTTNIRLLLIGTLLIAVTMTANGDIPTLDVQPVVTGDQKANDEETARKGLVDTRDTRTSPIDFELREHKKYVDWLAIQKSGMSPLQQLALQDDLDSPNFSDVLPYRYSDTTLLEEMLEDPQWVKHWPAIAVTIAMAADENAANRLLGFISTRDAMKGYEGEAQHARFAALTGLQYTLTDQQVPEVMALLAALTDRKYAEGLDISKKYTANGVKKITEIVLSKVASDEAISILIKNRNAVSSATGQVQLLSTDNTKELTRINALIENAERRQSGLPPEPLKDGDAVP